MQITKKKVAAPIYLLVPTTYSGNSPPRDAPRLLSSKDSPTT